MLVAFRRLLAIPMLPDPYAASFEYEYGGGRISGAASTGSQTPAPDLAAIVTWPKPDDATVQMLLLPQTAGAPQAQAATGIVSRTPTVAPSYAAAVSAGRGPDPQTTRAELLLRLGQLTSSGPELFRLLDVSSNA